MKRIASILLLGILFYNWIGYRWLIGYMQDKAKQELEARLDNNDYDESQLISIKVPITRLSYYNPSCRWDRVDGSIEVGGVEYKYVKRRIFNDSIEMLCVPDHSAMKLQAFNNDFFRLVNGFQGAAGKRQCAHLIRYKAPVADAYVFSDRLSLPGRFFRLLPMAYHRQVFIPSSPVFTDERPPACPA